MADWLDGKHIPQAMDILPRALTAENHAAHDVDLANPSSVSNDTVRRDSYLKIRQHLLFDPRELRQLPVVVGIQLTPKSVAGGGYLLDEARNVHHAP